MIDQTLHEHGTKCIGKVKCEMFEFDSIDLQPEICHCHFHMRNQGEHFHNKESSGIIYSTNFKESIEYSYILQ